MIKYYDIGLNLFCKQFRDSERIIQEAEESGVCCILTGTDPKENKKITEFVKKTSCLRYSGESIPTMQTGRGRRILFPWSRFFPKMGR